MHTKHKKLYLTNKNLKAIHYKHTGMVAIEIKLPVIIKACWKKF
jgi:hypothetical protein